MTAPEWPTPYHTTTPPSPSPFFDDYIGCTNMLENESGRIFTDSEKMSLEACTISSHACKAEKLGSLSELHVFLEEVETVVPDLKETPQSVPTSKIFFITAPSSRARLSISPQAFKTLLNHIGVFPLFIKTLSSFGFEHGSGQDGRGGFYQASHKSPFGGYIYETSYLLKHIEAKPGSAIPFSIRQMGLYQKYHTSSKESSNILLQSSQAVQQQIFRLVQEGSMARFPESWGSAHEVLMAGLGNGWREFVGFLEGRVGEIEDAVRYAKRGTPERVTFTTLQQLSKYSDILIRLSHALQANINTLQKLSGIAQRREKLEGKNANIDEYESFQASIESCMTEHEFLKHHVELVKDSSKELGELVRNTIALTDADVMLGLSQKTIQEARTMRTITFVALIYLPATFTATFLGMGLIHVESSDGVMRLSASKDMLFYLAITLPLMAVTFLGWGMWEFLVRRKRKRLERDLDCDDEGKLKGV